MEDANENEPRQEINPNQQMEYFAALVSSVNALRLSVEMLQQSTNESQSQIQHLRNEVNAIPKDISSVQEENIAQDKETEENSRASVNGNPERISKTPVRNEIVAPTHGNDFRLCDLPTFDGNIEEWPLFYATFQDTTNEFKYSNRQNSIRLNKCLLGPAKEVVASMLIHASDLPNAIEELKFRFGRPDLLADHQSHKISQFPTINEAKLSQIVSFSTVVRNVVAFLTSADCQQKLYDPSLLKQMVMKLPTDKQYDWTKHASNIKPFPTIKDFSIWLSALANIVCLMPSPSPSPITSRVTMQPQQNRRFMYMEENKKYNCCQCGGEHNLANCHTFRNSQSVEDRWRKVKSEQLCFSCLQKGHNSLNCRYKKICGINGCRRHHHQSLHEEAARNIPAATQVTSEVIQPFLSIDAKHSDTNQLFKVLPVTLYGPKGQAEVLVMFDEGSAISLLEENTAKQLGLKGSQQPLTLQWYGQRVITEESTKVTLEIAESGEQQHRFNLRNIRTIKNLNLPAQSFRRSDFDYLKFLPLQDYDYAKPVMLLGLDYVHLGISTTIVESGSSRLVAAKTKLGWVAYGPSSTSSQCPVILHIRQNPPSDKLHQAVTEYFATENFGTNDLTTTLESKDDAKAKEIMEKTIRRVGKRFEIGLLWKDFPPKLPPSFVMAEKRLVSIENKMSREPDFAERYRREMNKYFEKGYARKLSVEEIKDTRNAVWYLPHFAVQNPHKPDKLRIVFDAAASSHGIFLNTALFKGPERAKPLIKILFHFRQGKIGAAADIREMFSQIQIRPSDQHAQRFLWRNGDRNEQIQHFAMVSMIFGAVCSPCCAEYIKNHNAEDFKQNYPDAAAAIIDKHYVDDFVCSFQSEEEAQTICKQVVNIHAEAGFDLRNFVSNTESLQVVMNGNTARNEMCPINMEKQSTTEKVLGMFWDTKTDTFKFQTKFHKIPRLVLDSLRAPTKRELLGIIMAVFDPYGLLADFLIFSKILIQDTWKLSLNWDDQLPLELEIKWRAWWGEFQKLNEFEIKRCYSPNLYTSMSIELHMFVDASQAAFSAVGYFRFIHSSGIDVAFVAGKTRTAPQKLMSIPRLELQAAVLGVRLSNIIRQSHKVQIARIILWSDSRTVLHWIYSSERKFKPFVGHRIAEIINSTCPGQWRWVPTAQNTADEATRQIFPPKFKKDRPWIVGPEFLRKTEDQWPEFQLEIPIKQLEEEIDTKVILIIQASNDFISYKKFSSFLRLKRVTAWALRFIKNSRIKFYVATVSSLPKSPLEASELDAAEHLLCKFVQREQYAKEVSALLNSDVIPKNSPIYSLNPYLDEYGLLRVHGRIDEARCLPLSARRPILMPQKHYISELIMQYFHEKFHHQNTSVIINEARQKFWFVQIKSVLKTVQRNCLTCRIDKAQPKPPLMGQLPVDRVTPYVRPFTYTGVDLFGPLNVTIGRRKEKRWAVIFTCLTIRAAHLELAENLSTDAFIVCLRNFINRRGTPKIIRSDNGTNFIGAQKELKRERRLLDTDRIVDETSKDNIEWVFNCPANPSSGGCWERLIRIIKRLLAKTLIEESPRVETLRSVLIEAENIINARPLTEIPLTSDQDEPITPNHFLIGCANSTQTPHPVDTKICLQKQWRIAQNLKDRLWKRWVVEYLPQLLCRSKWHDKPTPLQVDDLVIVCDPSQPRSQWQKGRITKLFPAKDGNIRIVEVRTATGIMKRPATKLAVLTVDGESQKDPRGVEC